MLENIQNPKDLRSLDQTNLTELAHDMREFILDTLSTKPGHLGANLGVIELSIALHYHYQTPHDLLVWDVGHQAYPHKILTERKEIFDTLRQKNGIAGFPVRSESEYDAFGVGHSSTSISAITGMAFADKIHHIKRKHIAIIGDASITSGMALEAMNHLGETNLDVLIILNDNSIGIDPSSGYLKHHFKKINEQRPNIFEDFGLTYLGSFDGHSFDELFKAFNLADQTIGPKIIHIKTTKGKGYENAEKDQVKWHAPGKFDKNSGEILVAPKSKTYQDVFGETLSKLMTKNPNIVAITPAMLTGSQLINTKNQFPNRVFDVGIAEQHSVTFAAGLATQNIVPFTVIYSTFLQRAYDQVIHDVALQNLPVVFCIDRAGIVGSDGATHHGYFDISFLNSIPNVILSTARNEQTFRNLLYTAQFTQQPFAIRYPKDKIEESLGSEFELLEIGSSETLTSGSEIAICSTGKLSARILKIIQKNQLNHQIKLIDFPFIKPIDIKTITEIKNYKTIISFEEGIANGGFGENVLCHLQQHNFRGNFILKAYPDEFISHATIDELEQEIGIDEESITQLLLELISSD